ncbi:DNA-binding LacI/PurR family transcriptional regulator [Deinobacterium chartae]|uniref:DNA-binding LacI/PurR family transcriptional regulator n=1 Tax=Deinobacterium chartae TaxID=521158 RepID=A0A841I3G6_9DEIO|nr:LacI family DNA-binding transcriptional regulator [Deinobacterium chartae]MBB6099843.1 DNA-binding LacI/PurR family transcriptional regulator [Deinobacterium chartae]
MDVKTSSQAVRRPTLKEVAAAVGVAPSTVSNAYNRPDQLSEALRERILEAARRLGYPGPNATARQLRRGCSGALGVLYADRLSYAFADPVALSFFEGVAAAAEEAGLSLLLVPGPPEDPGAVRAAAVDGFVIYSLADSDPRLGAALERRLPTVFVDQPPPPGVLAPLIAIDDRGGARQAAEHLIALGHRRFGIVSFELAPGAVGGLRQGTGPRGSSFALTRDRLEGYAEALAAAGIDWSEVALYECPENDPSEGRAAAEYLLGLPQPPTALLVLSDQLALGVLEAARARGIAVPQQLSVVGFDDIPAAALVQPALTTVRQPLREKGAWAGELLLALLRGETPHSPPRLATELVLRASSGPAPEVTRNVS